jgi:iron complex outermembrane receptor protein
MGSSRTQLPGSGVTKYTFATAACATFLAAQPTAYAGEAAVGTLTTTDVPETVVVTASPFAQNLIELSASVAQVTREELLTSGGIGLGDALKNVPGVTSSGFTAGSSRPVIRGLGATRVRVTENGLGSHDASDVSDDHAVPIDPLAALEVEVLRGPATLRYGSQAIGGVVNSINNRIPIDLGEGTNFEGFASISGNSIEPLGGVVIDYRRGNWAFHADGLIRGADDYDTPDGTQNNTFSFGRGFALGGGYIGNAGAGGLGYNQFIAHYGIPTEPGGEEVAHIDLDQKNYGGALRFTLPGFATIEAQGVYTDYTHSEIVDGEGVLSTFNNKEWEARIEAIHESIGPLTMGAIGVQFGNREYEALGEAVEYLLPTETDGFAAYAFEELALSGSFRLQGAARAEWTKAAGKTDALEPFDLDFTPVSFSLGAVFTPAIANTSFFANASWTQRAPHVTELFAQGPHEATGTFEIGDPSLDIERAFSIEGGIKHEAPNENRASFSIYHTKFEGFIYGLLTGNSYDDEENFFPDESGEFRELLYAQQDATFWGLEGMIHWHLLEGMGGRFGIDAQADYVRAEFDDDTNVPRIPPFRIGGGIFYEGDVFEAHLSALYNAAQEEVGVNEMPTGSFITVDASATIHLARGAAGEVNLVLSVSNLTDSVGHNHVSFTKDFVQLPGRTFRLMLHLAR